MKGTNVLAYLVTFVNNERKTKKFYDTDIRIHELPATLPREQNPEAVHQLRLELPAPGIETESGLFVPK